MEGGAEAGGLEVVVGGTQCHGGDTERVPEVAGREFADWRARARVKATVPS